jgi:IPT/TIG domain-containing protein
MARAKNRLRHLIHFGCMQLFSIAACFLALTVVQSQAPVISSIRPTSAPVGMLVTISGKGFTPTAGVSGSPDGGEDYGGNTVQLGSDVTLRNLNSADGVTVKFEIPQGIAPGVYGLKIVNSNGASNTVNLTITGNRH